MHFALVCGDGRLEEVHKCGEARLASRLYARLE
jgi:hypothetical protein